MGGIPARELAVLWRYRNGDLVRLEDRKILEKYRSAGWVRYGMEAVREGDRAKIRGTAKLTSLGRRIVDRDPNP